jgi:hypothetical protein
VKSPGCKNSVRGSVVIKAKAMASIIYYSAHSFASSVLHVCPVAVEYQQKPEKFPQKTRYVPSKIKSRSEETKANLSRATTTTGASHQELNKSMGIGFAF